MSRAIWVPGRGKYNGRCIQNPLCANQSRPEPVSTSDPQRQISIAPGATEDPPTFAALITVCPCAITSPQHDRVRSRGGRPCASIDRRVLLSDLAHCNCLVFPAIVHGPRSGTDKNRTVGSDDQVIYPFSCWPMQQML